MNDPSTPLDRFHDRLMEPDEAARFEAELARSPGLRAELAVQHDVDARLRAGFGAPASKPSPTSSSTPTRNARTKLLLGGLAAALAAAAVLVGTLRSRAALAPPPGGAPSWAAWATSVHARAPQDLVGCQVVDPTAPVGPVALGGALWLPMGWRVLAVDVELGAGTTAYHVVARDGRAAIVLVRAAGEPALELADEPGLAVAHRDIAGLALVELALPGPPFVLGAVSAGL